MPRRPKQRRLNFPKRPNFPKRLPDELTETLITEPLKDLATIKRHERTWHMPIVAAIAISFPVFMGAYFNQLSSGLLSALGAMVILNTPYVGSLMYRMIVVMACGFGMISCFSFGLIAHSIPMLTLPVMFFMVFWVALFARYFELPPPAGTFIVMAGMAALFMPVTWAEAPMLIGRLALGVIFAGICACIYSLILLFSQTKIQPRKFAGQRPDILIDSTIMATIVSLSLAFALLLGLPRPYWAPVSCYVVIQGMTISTVWTRQLHRVVGTVLGLGLAWVLMQMHLNAWGVAMMFLVLVMVIETLTVRNYALSVVMLTPMTIFMVEYGAHADGSLEAVIRARLFDTLLGSLFAFLGIWVVINQNMRVRLQRYQAWVMGHFHKLDPNDIFVK